jgi:hypothetical protein
MFDNFARVQNIVQFPNCVVDCISSRESKGDNCYCFKALRFSSSFRSSVTIFRMLYQRFLRGALADEWNQKVTVIDIDDHRSPGFPYLSFYAGIMVVHIELHNLFTQ